jgi:hypothetical protein
VGHLRANGFAVKDEGVGDLGPIKTRYKVPVALESCHTAVIDGYVVEGHVPADTIKRLLRERPRVAGIGVPGMPVGAPGMEAPGQPPEPYQVFAFDSAGTTAVFERH